MRKVSVVLLLALSTTTTRAQIFGLGFGYNVNFLSANNLNFIIDRYNETRNFLDDEMQQITLPRGFTLNLVGGSARLFYETGYNWIRQMVFAQGTDSSNKLRRRDVRLKMDTWHFGLGTGAVANGVAGIVGGAIEVGRVKAQTRVGDVGEVKSQKWEKENAVKDFNLYLTVFGQILLGGPGPGFRLGVEPYYRFGLLQTDFTKLNESINPITSGGDPSPLNSTLSSLGLKVLLVFMLSG